MNEPIYERMQQLIRQIRQADTAYYKHDAPIMSDLEYDRLIDDLVALEEDSGVILSNSPTQHVAGETLETLMQRFGTQSRCFLLRKQNLSMI
ncbi:MAG: DNA ligase LigA-related protein [Oscillospiraceae bacterium]